MMFNIVQHVSNVSFEHTKISRLVLNFKLDDKDNVWLLYCSTLRTMPEEDERPHGEIPDVFSTRVEYVVPDVIDRKVCSILEPRELRKTQKCSNCRLGLEAKQTFELRLSQVITAYSIRHWDENGQLIDVQPSRDTPRDEPKGNQLVVISETAIPPLVKNINPKLKLREYKRLSVNPTFLRTSAPVCERCFVMITNVLMENETKAKTIDGPLVGKGRLRPEFTRFRSESKAKMLQEDGRRSVAEQKRSLSPRIPSNPMIRNLMAVTLKEGRRLSIVTQQQDESSSAYSRRKSTLSIDTPNPLKPSLARMAALLKPVSVGQDEEHSNETPPDKLVIKTPDHAQSPNLTGTTIGHRPFEFSNHPTPLTTRRNRVIKRDKLALLKIEPLLEDHEKIMENTRMPIQSPVESVATSAMTLNSWREMNMPKLRYLETASRRVVHEKKASCPSLKYVDGKYIVDYF
eukprot:TRINITY_DN7260_c0_g3_i2.p1 TRINITY_DN7260_c0_g3~~TRINITY_DN7260_c0_g3_i2.p1  ORF type:complete len:459 (-),score=75.03 TRINITY_DN7260_c0_g3_i2:156-1532(-)